MTTTTEKALAVGIKIIDGIKYQVFFTEDPDCPVLLKRIGAVEELGHKGRSWRGR